MNTTIKRQKIYSRIYSRNFPKSGFIPTNEKFTWEHGTIIVPWWEPCKIFIWLGRDINLLSGALKITKSRIDNILNAVSLISWKMFVSSRILVNLLATYIIKIWHRQYCTTQNSIFSQISRTKFLLGQNFFNLGNYNDTDVWWNFYGSSTTKESLQIWDL